MILIAVGANLPGPHGSAIATCRSAVAGMAALPLLRHRGTSAWYETAPEGEAASGPPYVNGVARFDAGPALDAAADAPARLLEALARIEATHGRVRSVANAPRTLDLDIIAIGDLARLAPDPVLPHPRAHLRRFVLLPLLDVAPEWRHPALGLDAAALLRGLPKGEARRLADEEAGD